MDRIDLHLHSTCSDGTLTPAELLEKAAALGLRAVSITDHDSVAAYAALPGSDAVELVTGVELSAVWQGHEIHVLGYDFDPTRLDILDRMRRTREHRNAELLRRLLADGIPIDAERLRASVPGGVVGRPHIAAALVELGLFPTVQAAFDLWLGEGGRYAVPRERPGLVEAASAIRSAGGKPVLAHPLQYALSPTALRTLAADCCRAGFAGLETHYGSYTPQEVRELSDLAAAKRLCCTGGSDYHGPHRPEAPMDCARVPACLLPLLRSHP